MDPLWMLFGRVVDDSKIATVKKVMTVNKELSDVIKIINALLNISGVGVGTDGKQVLLYITLIWCFTIDVLFAANIYTSFKEGNYEAILFIWPCLSYNVLGITKTMCVFRNRNVIGKILMTLQKYSALRENMDDEDAKEIKLVKVAVVTTISTNLVALTIFWVTPIVLMLTSYRRRGQLEASYMFPLHYYFIDVNCLKFWIFIYIHQAVQGLYALVTMNGPDALLYVLCTYTFVQFRSLGRSIEHIIEDIKSRDQLSDCSVPTTLAIEALACEDYTAINEALADAIKTHQILLNIVEDIDAIFSKATLLNFIFSSSQICMTLFNVAVTGDHNMASFVTLLLATLWQILLFCYYGDLVISSNKEVLEATMRSNWYLADEKLKKSILLIMVRSQKACRLTAFRYFNVDLMAFRKVLGTSWSYFALLNRIYSK